MCLSLYFLFFTILSASCFEWILSYSWNKPVCDFKSFYEPYITVQLTRTSPPTLSETTENFVDLRTKSGILCINGPAFLYKTISRRSNGGDEKQSVVFFPNPAEIDVYYNQCMTFNRRKFNIDLGNQSSAITKNTTIMGLKIYGIALVTASNDYRDPHHRMFYQTRFGYNLIDDEEYSNILDASFAFVSIPSNKLQTGLIPILDPSCSQPNEPRCAPPHRVVDAPKALCIQIAGNNTILVFVPKPTIATDDGDTGYVCTLQPEENLRQYFTKKTPIEIYTWVKCPDGYGDEEVDEITEITIDSMEDFRIIDPKHKTSKGTPGKIPKPGYPNYNIKTTVSGKSPTYERFPFPGYSFQNEKGGEANAGASENLSYRFMTTDVKDCKPITLPDLENVERPIRNIPLRLEDDAPQDSNKSSNFFVYKQISSKYDELRLPNTEYDSLEYS